jgi:hypothetical protein
MNFEPPIYVSCVAGIRVNITPDFVLGEMGLCERFAQAAL